MSEVPKLPRRHYRGLDSLRGLAAISILVIHVAIFSGGLAPWYGRFIAHLDIGVPFFFLLSAFLLYRPFVYARLTGNERSEFGGYARRRFIRIAPAYWAALTIAAIVPGMAGAFSGNWWAYYGLLQNFPIYTPDGTCAIDPFRCGIPPAWSLAVEVFFYALLPLLVLAMARVGGRGRGWLGRELAVFGAIAVVSFVIQSGVPLTDVDILLFFSPLGRGWWFGLGLALASVSVAVELRPREPRFIGWLRSNGGVAPLAGLGLYLAASAFVLEPAPSLAFPVVPPSLYVAEYFLVGIIALLVLLPSTLGTDGGGLYRRALAHPFPTWLGKISYGIFLWQFPVLIFLLDAGLLDLWPSKGFPLLLATTLAGTIVCAALSFYLLERPLLRRFRTPRRPGSTPPPSGTTRPTLPAPMPSMAADQGRIGDLRSQPMRAGES